MAANRLVYANLFALAHPCPVRVFAQIEHLSNNPEIDSILTQFGQVSIKDTVYARMAVHSMGGGLTEVSYLN